MYVRKINGNDKELLFRYFQSLSPETLKRFEPHPFDDHTANIISIGNYKNCMAYICLDDDIIAGYAIVKPGYLDGEVARFAHYPLLPDYENDYTLAPSVADAYQSKGVGSLLFEYIERDLKARGAKKILLWGGVQFTNQRAVRFYLKHGFRILGEFEHNGSNLDMFKHLNDRL
jgi:diamine N-acetyltransferase